MVRIWNIYLGRSCKCCFSPWRTWYLSHYVYTSSTAQKKEKPEITILYGNRTPETVTYADELKSLNHPWKGYKGFITEDIVKKELLKAVLL